MDKKGFNSSKNLIIFFIATLAWTWICGLIPTVLGIMDTSLGQFIFYFGGGGPSVVGGFLVLKTYSKKLRKAYFKSYFDIRGLGFKWFVWVIGFFSLISIVGIFISTQILGYEIPEMNWLKTLFAKPYMLILFLLLSFVSGPLNEEFGWRGYSLDRLFIRFGYVKSNLILGFIWSIWHLFWYLNPGQAQYHWLQHSLLSALSYIPSVILLNFVVSYIYVNNNRSIFSGLFVHMISNFITAQLLISMSVETEMVIRGVSIVMCLIVAIYSSTSKKFMDKFNKSVDSFKQDILSIDKE